MPILSASNVSKTYRSGSLEVEALRGVDIEVEAGEMVIVMGPSGNGKTTLLNCLSGLDDVDSGEVVVEGRSIHDLSDRKRTRHRAESMGFVFQAFNLIPVLSAVENTELPLLVNGARSKVARQRAAEMLERVGLGDRMSHRPNELSGGEQQRVTIARALVNSPSIVWADEPTGNLDAETAGSVLELLGEVNRQGQTVVMVTHEGFIADMADRLVLIRNGAVEYDGHPAQAPRRLEAV
ncbi:MAG: ABC transporter ATP-binding protein [Acidimicrobiia bacterium]|jgi:putative ABC transport system ATP-binding protein